MRVDLRLQRLKLRLVQFLLVFLLPLNQLIDLKYHVVETVNQLSHLVLPTVFHTHAEISLFHFFHGGADLPDGLRDLVRTDYRECNCYNCEYTNYDKNRIAQHSDFCIHLLIRDKTHDFPAAV